MLVAAALGDGGARGEEPLAVGGDFAAVGITVSGAGCGAVVGSTGADGAVPALVCSVVPGAACAEDPCAPHTPSSSSSILPQLEDDDYSLST